MPVVGVADAVALLDAVPVDPDPEDVFDGADDEECSPPAEAAKFLLSLFRVRLEIISDASLFRGAWTYRTPRPTPRPMAIISKAAKAAHSHLLFFFPLLGSYSAHFGFSLVPRVAAPVPMAATAGVMWPCSSSSSLVDNRSPLA